jgi:uncharacterized membrane protein
MNSEIRYLAQQLLQGGLGPLCERDRRVIARVARRVHTARDVNKVFEQNLSVGDRLADKVAIVAGSWTFIAGFCAFLAAWTLLNALLLVRWAFDPYPFIFLNLLLSMLAALQAPIIMMSQNRQAAKDRLAAALDYEVNVKAESAIAELHDKVDRLAQLMLQQARGEAEERVSPRAEDAEIMLAVPARSRQRRACSARRRQSQRIGVADDGAGAGNRAPGGQRLRIDLARLARSLGKSSGQLADQGFVAGPEPPGTVALRHLVALRREGLAQRVGRIRPCGRP